MRLELDLMMQHWFRHEEKSKSLGRELGPVIHLRPARNLPDHNSRMWIWWRFCNIPYYDLGMNSVVVGKKIRWLDQNVRHCGCDLWSRVVPVTLTRIGQSANSGEHSICLGHRTHILLAETTLQYSCKDTQPVSYRCAKNRRITCGKYATHSRL